MIMLNKISLSREPQSCNLIFSLHVKNNKFLPDLLASILIGKELT